MLTLIQLCMVSGKYQLLLNISNEAKFAPFSSLLMCYIYVMLILQVFEIIGFVYQYIKLLRQVLPQEWIFWELQDKLNMRFRYLEEEPQDDYATELGGFFCY